MLDVTEMTPVGATLTGFRVDTLDAGIAAELRSLLAEYGVIVLPAQHADDAHFLRFLRSFGPTMFTVGETPVPGHPELNVVSNVGRATPARSSFHTDTSYVRQPPAFTALRAVVVPDRGGQTEFTNQYRAYETLPADIRDELRGHFIRHVMTGLQSGPDAETTAPHPIVRDHPISGRSFLYLSTPTRCSHVSGMSAAQAVELIEFLFAHCTRPDNVYRHNWSPGDVVMWDNRVVLHRADHAAVVGDRVMHRGMVADNGWEQSGHGPG